MKKHLTIKQYQQLHELDNMHVDDTLEKRISTASILSGKDPQQIKRMSLIDLNPFVEKTINEYDFEFIDKLPKGKIKVHDMTYYIVTDMQKIISGQLMDLSMYAEKEEDVIKNLHYIVAIFLREDKNEYDGTTLDERALIMQNHCSYNEIYKVALFFCKLLTNSHPLLTEILRKSLQTSSNDGDGSFI